MRRIGLLVAATAVASLGLSACADDSPGTGSSDGSATGTTGDPDAGDGDGDGDVCTSNDDCVGDPNGELCVDGECVPCTPDNDICDEGQYCTDDNVCVIGCKIDDDCPDDLVCDTQNNVCEGCVEDFNCPLGSICDNGDCVPGCTDDQPCQQGFSCCSGECKDLLNDVDNCGMCDNVCDPYDNAETLCEMGMCGMGMCDMGWQDCNQDPGNGCEVQGQCACDPGEKIDCYTGPMGTEDVGICHGGQRTCNDQGTAFGPCEGEQTPLPENCNDNTDKNCDGGLLNQQNPDNDNDGWGVCDGDCCDAVGPNCFDPDLVNPGAFELDGNDVDDDCDGNKDNPVPACDQGLASNSANPLDYAKAIDLCQFTTENPPLDQKIWGVIGGDISLANGAGNENANSRSIRGVFGNNIDPEFGANMAVFSSGYAASPGQNNPPHVSFQGGANMGTASQAPADWLAANGNAFPNAPGCPGAGSTTANDPVMLKLRVRVPTNAQSFSAMMFFFSAEYPEWVCTSFNDLFVTLVDSSDNGNPADKNIAIYTDNNNNDWPVGVNIVKAAPGLFTECTSYNQGQCGSTGNYNQCMATQDFVGTGFDTGACDVGGGTGWLQMSGNVEPGETMEIRFVIWDTADHIYDSLVILDDWQWSVQGSKPGIMPG